MGFVQQDTGKWNDQLTHPDAVPEIWAMHNKKTFLIHINSTFCAQVILLPQRAGLLLCVHGIGQRDPQKAGLQLAGAAGPLANEGGQRVAKTRTRVAPEKALQASEQTDESICR